MTSFQSQPANVEAEQWSGTDAALTAIQKLIFPASPLVGRPGLAHDPARRRLAIMADSANSLLKHELIYADIGSWIVKFSSGALRVIKEQEFAEMYRPAVIEAVKFAPSLADA